MLLQAALPTTAVRDQVPGLPGRHEPPGIGSDLLALILIATWSARTGRTLRSAPVQDLTAEELEEFWADDDLQPSRAICALRRLK